MLKQVFLLLFLVSAPLFADNVHTIRAAIDVGMGGPKLQVAEVDVATQKIVKILHSQRFFVNFYEGISQNADHKIDDALMEEGLHAIQQAIAFAQTQNVEGIVILATASLRSAANGNEFARYIQEKTGFDVHIVDQALEGQLAFQAAFAKIHINSEDLTPENLVVWDIGGGSIQLSGSFNGAFLVDCGQEGVGAFNDYIIKNIQLKNLKECKTPNPMTKDDIFYAKQYAYHLAQKVDQLFQNKIRNPSTKVVGAGSVFGHGIVNLVSGKNPFSQEDLALTVNQLPGKTDRDFGDGEYAFCEGSNAILALGYMQRLGIKQVHIVNVNNADGALLFEPFWEIAKSETSECL